GARHDAERHMPGPLNAARRVEGVNAAHAQRGGHRRPVDGRPRDAQGHPNDHLRSAADDAKQAGRYPHIPCYHLRRARGPVGGAGMSLAWGCGAMAADMALEQGDRRAAVLGCGSPGLTAARQLQRRGFAVTIYTLAVPPYTTSNMSSAGFTPTAGLVSADQRTPAWDAQFRQAAEISYRQLQLLAGAPGYGVYWIDNY